MNESETTELDSIDTRDVRALTDLLLAYEQAPGLFVVAGESGATYTVDVESGTCTCSDAEHRAPDGGCNTFGASRSRAVSTSSCSLISSTRAPLKGS